MNDDDTKVDRPSRPPAHIGPPAPNFGPRYRVIARLGRGGMGEVFHAYDNELQGEVALKIVRYDLDVDAALARFRREIALARKVTSPNVLRVYDLAEHDGVRFLSMEYVDGEDLAHLIRREHKLDLDRALSIFRQVCNGLIAAHEQGVVHRDLKPQNIMVGPDDVIRVADFGLARSIAESGMTASGAILGSPAYMSPEQVKGDPADARSDIYSLGIMLYQLVAAETPFHADTPHAVMEMRLHRAARPLAEVAPEAPFYLSAIVDRCLQILPDARYASVRDLLSDVEAARAPSSPVRGRPRRRTLVVAAAVAVLVAGGGLVAWRHGTRESHPDAVSSRPASSIPSPLPASRSVVPSAAADGLVIAVLVDFENGTSEPLLDRTLSDVIMQSLGRSRTIEPDGRGYLTAGAAELKTPADDLDGVAAKLAARDHCRVVLMHGKVAVQGAAFMVSLTATDATTKATLMTDNLNVSSLDGALPTLARMSAHLREALGDHVTEAERSAIEMSLHLDADNEYELGVSQSRAGDVASAIPHLERAIKLDPSFATARRALVTAYRNAARENDAIHQQQATLKLIDHLSERNRLFFLGDYYYTVTEEYDRSIAAFEEIRTKWPSATIVLSPLAISYQAQHQYAKALEVARTSTKEHPKDRIARGNLPIYEILVGNYQQAITELNQNLAELPHPMDTTHMLMAMASMLLGRRADAMAALDKLHSIDVVLWTTAAADIAAAEGRLREASGILEKQLADDLAHHHDDDAESEQKMLAEVRLRRGDKAGARAAASHVKSVAVEMFEAAVVLAGAGDRKHAAANAAKLAGDLAASHRAMAKMIEGELLRVQGKPQEAIVKIQEGLHISDLVFGHFLLARAALDAKAYTEAYSELQVGLARRGQVVAGIDGMSYRYWPPFTYYLAKAQDGLGSPEAAASYKAFLGMMHDPDPDDKLVADARRHVGP